MQRQTWFWYRVEPYWQAAFEHASKDRGFATRINDDVFLLEYALGARYDREDQREYEPVFYKAFVELIRPGMMIADIGAHFGFFSLGAARRVGDTGRVFSFEPSEETAVTLRRNILLNHLAHRIEVIQAVVSSKEALVSFYTSGTSMAASLSREKVEVLNPERPAAAVEIKVSAVALDQFCQSRGIVLDLIKLDVEGAEFLVLQGAEQVLLRDRPVILCEIHPLQMQQCGGSLQQLKEYVSSVGYTLEALDEPNATGIFHALLSSRQ